MDFSELKADLASRGFQRFSDGLLGQIINDARAELDETANWPYREANVTGTAPVAISDLGEVDQVFDMDTTPNCPLTRRSYAELVNDFSDVGATGFGGAPWFWYRATPGGVPTVATFPEGSRTIGVQYWRVTPALSGDADVPAAPERFHSLIVLIAERMAYARKDPAAAAGLQMEIDRQLVRMREALQSDDALAGQLMTGESCDG